MRPTATRRDLRPSVMLTLDPGRDMGWAVFRLGVLADCGLRAVPEYVRQVDLLVLEKPWIRPQAASKANPNDIIELAIRMTEARLAIHYSHLQYYYPHQWKGSAGKQQISLRILANLTPDERAVLRRGWVTCAASAAHNITEAAGIGLHHLGRLR